MAKYLNLNGYRALVHGLELMMHRGDRYTCPFCEYAAKDLKIAGFDLPVLTEKDVIGGRRRANACFKCGARDREKLLYLYLRDKMNVFGSDKEIQILHIAPEKG